MNKILRTLFMTLCWIMCSKVHAQQETWTSFFPPLSGIINDILIDGNNTWIAHEHGLTLYDGSSWEVFNTMNCDIPSNNIKALALDASGNLWVGTNNGGLAYYNGSSWTVYTTSNSGLVGNGVRDLVLDGSGNVWIATTSGLSMFDGSIWTNYTPSNSDIPFYSLNVIKIDGVGNKWMGNPNAGVCMFDGSNWTTYNTSNSGLPNNSIHSIVIDGSNKWFGTSDGLVLFDGTTWTVYNAGNTPMTNSIIRSIAKEGSNMWIGSVVGIYVFDGSNWSNYSTSNSGLSNNLVSTITIDGTKKWIGCGNNLDLLEGSTWTNFNPLNINSISATTILASSFDAQGNLWMGTAGSGIIKRDASGNWTSYTETNTSLPVNLVQALAIDGSGNSWFADGSFGLSKFNGSSWTHYTTSNSGLPEDDIKALAVDAAGNLWIGTSSAGVAVYNGTTWTIYNTLNSGIISDFIYSIAIDALGNKWIATLDGLSKFDGTNWTNYTSSNSGLPFGAINVVKADMQNNIWLGISGVGACKFDGNNWIQYTTSNSGIGGAPRDIAIDAQGDVWFATNSGLSRLSGSTWTTYDQTNSPLASNDIKTISISTQNDKWIGTQNGLYKLSIAVPPIAQNVIYVDSAATGNESGTSWANAFTTLSKAMEAAHAFPIIDTILIAKGTYYPTGAQSSTTRDSFFTIYRGNLHILGGYSNGGGNRDIQANPTILSGDIGIPLDTADNSIHVMVIVNVPANDSIVLDGLTITGGQADSSSIKLVAGEIISNTQGGGIIIYNNDGKIFINECSFIRNNVSGSGGAITCLTSQVYLSTCTFILNTAYNSNPSGLASISGGAIYNGNNGDIEIENCTFHNNYADESGGALYNGTGGLKIINSKFSGNESYNGGALVIDNSTKDLQIIGCVFSGNKATFTGGAIFNSKNGAHIINSTITGNSATTFGGGIYQFQPIILSNCVVWNNNTGIYYSGTPPQIVHSLIQDMPGGSGNLDGTTTNPYFVNPVSYNLAPTTSGDYNILPCSPLINSGINDSIPTTILKDLTGNDRIYEGIVDIGAYESPINTTRGDTLTVAICEGSEYDFGGQLLDQEGTYFDTLQSSLYGCDSIVTLNLTVNLLPDTLQLTLDGERCDAGSVLLLAVAPSDATTLWYDSPTGGTLLGTGNAWATPNITQSTSYYATSSNAQCESARKEIIATVLSTPTNSSLATGGTHNSAILNQGDTHVFTGGTCNDTLVQIEDIVDGVAPGLTQVSVLTLDTVPTLMALPPNSGSSRYVPRLFHILPTESVPGIITLYVLQSEFDAYNASIAGSSVPTLPNGPSDVSKISNIIVSHYYGQIDQGSTGPLMLYDASNVSYIPNSSITATWHPSGYWSITFPNVDFGGLYVIHTGNGPLQTIVNNWQGIHVDKRNKLTWDATNENTVLSYEIERSHDGNEFSNIGIVTAHSTQQQYTFWDESPIQGKNYYRLKITEVSGRHAYSHVIEVNISHTHSWQIDVWPNPVVNELYLSLHGEIDESARIELIDLKGSVLADWQIHASHQTLVIPDIATGVYILRYTDNQHVKTLKIQKQ